MEAHQASFFMVIRKQFNKPTLSIQEQIDLLKARGIIINNEELATHYLEFIGYYRLSAYFKFENNKYHPRIIFEEILEHYIFDRKLRMLLFDAIERIEIALRSVITNTMTSKHGAFWYNKAKIYATKPSNSYQSVLQVIRAATIEQKNKDTFIKHYYDTYNAPELPPSWMLMETLSMGNVSRILSLLVVEERKRISNFFKVKERHLVSWMRALTYTRNLCAHHARIWNRVFTLKVEADKRYDICRDSFFHKGKLYSQVVVIAILLSVIAPNNHFEQHIKELLNDHDHDHNYKLSMGFPETWDSFKLLL